jgi:hypothetical protein
LSFGHRGPERRTVRWRQAAGCAEASSEALFSPREILR